MYLIPFQVNGNHWLLVILDFDQRKVHVVDSGNGWESHTQIAIMRVVEPLLQWLLEKRDDDQPFNSTPIWIGGVPQQKTKRCGGFVCWWMYLVSQRGLGGVGALRGVDELCLTKAVGGA